MQLYFTTLTNNKGYVEYKAKVIKQGDRSSQSSGLGEWSTEHGDGAFPYPVAPPGVKCSYPKYDPVALLG